MDKDYYQEEKSLRPERVWLTNRGAWEWAHFRLLSEGRIMTVRGWDPRRRGLPHPVRMWWIFYIHYRHWVNDKEEEE